MSVRNAYSACTIACERCVGDEIYYDASETLSDYGTDLSLPAHRTKLKFALGSQDQFFMFR